MEGIELYPHNQKAYDNLCAMLRESNRACVVQPTGTGKFVIIAKMAQDNPGKNFLLLGTNDYMFIDQMANLSDIAPGFTPKNLQFMTYATAMAKARCGDEIPRCDVIVADEFHHCGAPEWGKGVQYVVKNNPDAKIVGFSATPIRYSDKGRNTARLLKGKSRISSKRTEEDALWSALRPESAMSPSKPLRRSMETDREAPGRGLAVAVKIPIAPLTANIGAIQMIWSQE